MERLGVQEGVPLPKYYRLKESIRGIIEDRQLGEGDLIPSERELCEGHGVSRMTARQAVNELVNEGVLYREQGRGTFVAGPKIQHETARLTSFTQDMQERGMTASSKVLGIAVEEAPPTVARALGVDLGEQIVRLSRVRNAEGKPMALENSYLLYEVGKSILGLDLSQPSLYDELKQRGIRITSAEQKYEATLLNEDEADHLGIPAGSAALLVERVTFDDGGNPIEYVKSIYRGDRYHVATVLHS